MQLYSALLILHASAAALAPEPGSATTGTDEPDLADANSKEARAASAKRLYTKQRYVESARVYEALFRESGEMKYLFNAAAAREGAGHEAHAFVTLHRFLSRQGIDPEDRVRAKARLASLQRRTITLQIIISPSPRPEGLELLLRRPGVEAVKIDDLIFAALDRHGLIQIQAEPGDWSVHAQAPGYHKLESSLAHTSEGLERSTLQLNPITAEGPAPPPSPTTTFPVLMRFGPVEAVTAGIDVKLAGSTPQYKHIRSSSATWHLAPGTWDLEASAPGFRPTRVSLKVPTATPSRISMAPKQHSRTATIVLGVLAGGSFTTGAAVAIVYYRSFNILWPRELIPESDGQGKRAPSRLEDNIAFNWNSYQKGPILIGGGVGIGVGALLTSFEHHLRRPNRAWATALAVGGSLTALGFGLSVLPIKKARFVLEELDVCEGKNARCGDLPSKLRVAGLANFAGGLGLGLAVSGFVGLIRLAWRNKPSKKSPTVALRGLTLSF